MVAWLRLGSLAAHATCCKQPPATHESPRLATCLQRLISSLQSLMKCAQGRIGSFSTRNSLFPARTLREVQRIDMVFVSCSLHDNDTNISFKCSPCRKTQPTTLLVDIIRSGKRSLIWSLTESESLRTTVLQLLEIDFRFADLVTKPFLQVEHLKPCVSEETNALV